VCAGLLLAAHARARPRRGWDRSHASRAHTDRRVCSPAPAGGRLRAGAPRRPQAAAGEALALPPGRSVLTFRTTLLKRGLYAARALRLGLGALTLRLAPRGAGDAGAPPALPPAPPPAPPPLGEVGADGARAGPRLTLLLS